MKFDDWESWYEKILNDFGFSRSMDENTAITLNEILKKNNSLKLEELFENLDDFKKNIRDFIVFGAGPSLKPNIKYLKEEFNLNEYILIAADGATSGLLEEDIVPDIIVTDLDGKIDDLLIANESNSIFVVHGHGNNLEAIIQFVPSLKKILGTTQSQPIGNLYNFGGFTDGDRAVFLAIALNAEKIILAGMDFGKLVTKYSRPDMDVEIAIADEIKEKKLKYAEQLIEWISNNEKANIVFL